MLRDYLINFKGDVGEQAQRGVFNCVQIIDYAHAGDMTGEDFSELDLRMCSLSGKKCDYTSFKNSFLSRNLLFFSNITPTPESVSLSADGKLIVSASRPSWAQESTIRIWDFFTGALIQTYEIHKGAAFDAIFSPNGKHIMVLTHCFGSDANWPREDWVKKVEYPKWESTIYGYTLYVQFARYSPDGKYILSIERSSNKIEVLDSNTGDVILVINASNPEVAHLWNNLTSASFCPEGKFIITSEHYQIYDVEFEELINREYKNGWSMESRGDAQSGRHWLIWGRNANDKNFFEKDDTTAKIIRKPPYEYHSIIKIWDLNGSLLYTIKDKGKKMEDVRYSLDGKFIITKSTLGEFGESYDVEIREKETGNILYSFKSSPSSNGKKRACYSLNGENIAVTFGDEINIYEVETGTIVHKIKRNKNSFDKEFVKIIYSPDGRYILSTTADGMTQIWSSSGLLVRTFGNQSYNKDNIFNEKGELLTYCKVERLLKIWNVSTGTLTGTYNDHALENDENENYLHGRNKEDFGNKHGNLIYRENGGNFHSTRRHNFDNEDEKYLRTIFNEWDEWLSDDKELYIKLYGYEYIEHTNNDITIKKNITNKLQKTITVSTSEMNDIKFAVYTPDARNILVFCMERDSEWRKFFCYLKVYDNVTGDLVNTINAGTYDGYVFINVHQVYLCQNKKCIVSLANGVIIIFDIEKGVVDHEIFGDTGDGGYHEKLFAISCNYEETVLATTNNDAITIWDIETGKQLRKMHYFPTDISGADLRSIKHDDLTKYDLLVLKQNGAIIEGVEPIC